MINLLPPQEKRVLREERDIKIVIVLGIVLWAALISSALVLFTVSIRLNSKVDCNRELLKRVKREFKDSEEQVLGNMLASHKDLLSAVGGYNRGLIVSDLVSSIEQDLPDGAYLYNLNYNQEGVTLSGYCPTRKDLFSLRDNLEEEFKVSLPSSILIKQNDVEFVINLEI